MTNRTRHLALSLWKYWVPLAFGLTVVIGFVYVAVLQSYRHGANDPQIELAENISGLLTSGVKASELISPTTPPADMAKSLSVFLIVFDKQNAVTASNTRLNGQTPAVPVGVLDGARQGRRERVSWEPQSGLRLAIVAVPVENGDGQVVVVGRSLREVEQRESELMYLAISAWVLALFGSLAIASFASLLRVNDEPTPSKPV